MIAGTMILEDSQLNWYYNQEGDNKGKITLTVSDGLTGKSKTIQCDPNSFAASIALAMSPDEFGYDPNHDDNRSMDITVKYLYELSELIMKELQEGLDEGEKNLLRFIP